MIVPSNTHLLSAPPLVFALGDVLMSCHKCHYFSIVVLCHNITGLYPGAKCRSVVHPCQWVGLVNLHCPAHAFSYCWHQELRPGKGTWAPAPWPCWLVNLSPNPSTEGLRMSMASAPKLRRGAYLSCASASGHLNFLCTDVQKPRTRRHLSSFPPSLKV